MFKGYQDLLVWQKSMDLTVDIYTATKSFPKEELYGLISQIRRSAVSISSNIAEGHARNTTGEFIQFIGIAKGSIAELETQIILAYRLGYIDNSAKEVLLDKVKDVSKMLMGLSKSLKLKKSKPQASSPKPLISNL
jgi:four helix bundle protein